jgi:hypothetical protein
MAMPLDLVALVRCFFGPRLRQLEGELQHAVDADAGHHRFLHHDLALGARGTCGRRCSSTRPRCSRARCTCRSRRAARRAVAAHHGRDDAGHQARGRRLTYWSNSRRNSSSEPHSDTWSASSRASRRRRRRSRRGRRSGPSSRRAASCRASRSSPSWRSRSGRTSGRCRTCGGRVEHAHALGHGFLADAVAGDDCDAILLMGCSLEGVRLRRRKKEGLGEQFVRGLFGM